MTLPRAIAIDIETAPDPRTFGDFLAANPAKSLRSMDPGDVQALLKDHLNGVGDKKASDLLAAFGGPGSFWTAMDEHNFGWLVERGTTAGVIAGKVKVFPSDFEDIQEKVVNFHADWLKERTREASFDPRLCRVVTVGLANDEHQVVVSIDKFGLDEAELLRMLWEFLASYFGDHKPCLIAYNGLGFDARVLTLRTLLHRRRGLRMPWPLDTRRGFYQPVADPYQYLTDWGKHIGGKGENTLFRWLSFFGIDHPTKAGGMDGSQVSGYVDAGRWAEIDAYCLDDAKTEWELGRVLWHQMFPSSKPVALPEALAPSVDPTVNPMDFAALEAALEE